MTATNKYATRQSWKTSILSRLMCVVASVSQKEKNEHYYIPTKRLLVVVVNRILFRRILASR